LDDAHNIAKQNESDHKWRQLGDLALTSAKVHSSHSTVKSVLKTNSTKLDLAEECLLAARDLNGLLLLYSSTANANGMTKLAALAADQGTLLA